MAQITELTNTGDLDTGAGSEIDLADTAGDEETTPNGPLLDLPPKDAAKRVIAMRKLRNRTRKRRAAEAMRVVYWRKGYRFVSLTGDEDRGSWKATIPMGSSKQPPNPNKIDRLIRRVISVITADKPVPKAIPERDDDTAIAAAEMSTSVLKVETGPNALNFPRLLRRLMDKSCTFRSGFVFFYIDPKGGGHRPLAMMAHPDAAHMADATQDPMTGAPADPEQLAERYVMADGSLTDDSTQAAPQWLPKTKHRLLTPQHVDLIPETADSVDEADGVTIQLYCTLGELRTQFPDFFESLDPGDLKKLVTYKPEDWKQYLPREMRSEWVEPKVNEKQEYDDDVIVFPVYTFYKQCNEYPCGAFVVTVGDQLRVHAEKWCQPVELPDGSSKIEYLEIPVAQCRCLDDDVDDENTGVALGEKLGPMDEIRATILGYALDYLFRFGNPQPYLPIGTTVQPKQLVYRTGDPIYVPAGGQVFYEEVPEFPHKISEMGAEMSNEMDDESNLQQAAQGVEAPSVKSGIHAETIVSQANVALSQMRENAANCYTRMCMIVLQLWRVFYDIEQQIDVKGEDGAWQRDAWIGTDLGSTKLVEIEEGSFTMQSPQQKQATADRWMAAGILKPDAYEQIITNSIAPELGVQTNPDRARIMRQLEQWRKGPTPADVQAYQVYVQAYQLYQQQLQAYQLEQQQMALESQRQAAAAGGPVATPAPQQPAPQPPPPLVLPGDPFATNQLACDQEQDAAEVRWRALRRFMPTNGFGGKPQFWQQALTAEYERMRLGAGKLTVAEMSQMQMRAAQLKLEIAQTPKVEIRDTKADPTTVGPDIQAAEASYQGAAEPNVQLAQSGMPFLAPQPPWVPPTNTQAGHPGAQTPAASAPAEPPTAPAPAHPIVRIPPRPIPTAPPHAHAG
jgi:hypothetical protein